MNKTNQKGIEIIKDFEGLKLTAYLCPSNVWTIGYGHTKGVRQGEIVTTAEAEGLLKVDLIEVEKTINSSVKVFLTENQFSAISSFVYNIGISAFKKSTLLKLLNQRDFNGAAEQFGRWVKGSDGKTLQGLVRRREAEKNLFLS